VRAAGSTEFGTRCEIKNMNSLRSLGRAIEYEAARQIELIEAGERIVQETRHWNENEGRTSSMRSKEEAFDYRYFPEPDLVPLAPDAAWQQQVRDALPTLPAERRERLASAAGMAPADVATIVSLDLDGLVHAAIEQGADPRKALNRAENEVAADLDAAHRLRPEAFARLAVMESKGELTATQAKAVVAELLRNGGDPAEIARGMGFEAMGEDAVAAALDEVIAANAQDWDAYVGGNDKVAGKFVGQVMKTTGGKADGKAVTRLLQERRTAAPT
jgi:aspartyl-tRNA(Asn)/glutamyl-tRNA(Gln) amidotransferase subunit B